LLLETIESVLNQSCQDFKIIVSDNSSNDETKALLEKRAFLQKVEYRKRDREYSSLEHFNMCLSEVTTKYFVLFHDDDVMMPDFVDAMYSTIVNSSCAAVGTNACILNNKEKTNRLFYKEKKDSFVTVKRMVHNYCLGNIAPFPGYIYNKEILRGLKFSDECEKYSDVIWLFNVANLGRIMWLAQPHMYYRVHSSQDSQIFDFNNQKKLINKYISIVGEKNRCLNKYRRDLLYMEMSESYKKDKVIPCSNLKMLFKMSKFLFIKFILKVLIKT